METVSIVEKVPHTLLSSSMVPFWSNFLGEEEEGEETTSVLHSVFILAVAVGACSGDWPCH